MSNFNLLKNSNFENSLMFEDILCNGIFYSYREG